MLSVAAMVSAGAAAQTADHVGELGDLSIKELMQLEVDSVYGASRYVQDIARAPASVTVIMAEDIKRFGARTLDDVLNSVRGMYVPTDRNYTYLGIRGFQRPNDYNTRVLVLVDGHRMNDNVYDLGITGREGMVDIDMIERVEVIRGPSSSIYGSSAFLGVINVVTKRGTSVDGLEAYAEGGTYDTFKSRMTFGTEFENGIEWLVSGSQYGSAGPSNLYFADLDQRISDNPMARNDGIAHELDGEHQQSFFSTMRWGDLTVSAFWNDRLKEVPTASFGTAFGDPRQESVDKKRYIDVRYDHHFTERLSLQARAFHDDVFYAGVYPYDFAEAGSPPEIVLFKDRSAGEWLGTELQLTAKLPERHTVIVGIEYRDNMSEDQDAHYATDPPEYTLLDDRSSRVIGLFAQSETELRSDLLLTVGLRYDRYQGSAKDALNPRFALIYSLDGGGTIKGMYGEAFRAPNPYERYYNREQANQPPLDVETIETYEVAYETVLAGDYQLAISGYHYVVEGLITQTVTDQDAIYFANIDGAHAHGVELEVRRQFASGASLRTSYALQRAEDGATREDLSSSPRRMAKLNLGLPFNSERLFAGLELQYHGAARTLRGNRADDFLATNFTLSSRPRDKGLEISGTIYNVFDERYGYPGSQEHAQDVIEQNGRTFLGRLTYHF
jgi:outer membrane receptor protein involved in Fe transport